MREIMPAAVASAAIELLTYDGGYDESLDESNVLVPTPSNFGVANPPLQLTLPVVDS